MAEAPEEPGYVASEKAKPGFVRLRCKMEGLKVKSRGFMDKVFKKHPHPEGTNAVIEVPTYHVRGFELNVRGGTGTSMRGAHYKLQIRRLPYDIDPESCYLTAEDDWVTIFLKKADEDQSWEDYVRDSLETATEPQEKGIPDK